MSVVVDARGLRCPMPVIKAARVAKDLPSGTELLVISTDPASAHDLPAWARLRGYQLIELIVAEDEIRATVRL